MTTPDFTTQAFLDWLRQQPPERAYNYWDKGNCAVACFAKDTLGFDGSCDATSTVVSDSQNLLLIPKQVAHTINSLYVSSHIFTAAQLLEKFKS